MAITVTLQGLSEFRGQLPQIPENIQKRVILDLSQVAYDFAERGARRHARSTDSALMQSLFNQQIPNGRMVGHDLKRAPQALFVNAGTVPHIIRPKDKKALRWVVGNRFIFAKEVKHPGYRGDGYIIQSATEALRQFAAIVDKATKDSA